MNTVVNQSGRLFGFNTDGKGLVAAIGGSVWMQRAVRSESRSWVREEEPDRRRLDTLRNSMSRC